MDWIIALGSFCLGALIGALVAWFVSEAEKMDHKVLAGAISALVGSSVLAMFSFLAGLRGPTHEYWFYPVGLLIGFVAVMLLELRYYDYYGKKRPPKKSAISN